MAASCSHLSSVAIAELPSDVDGCKDCLRDGGVWLDLRICVTCGHVGCCDSSPNRHARRHSAAIGDPLLRSLVPGESWSYCFADDVALTISAVRGQMKIPPAPMLRA